MDSNWIVLIGVVIIVVGFLLKLDVIAVVIVAAIATGLVAGLSFPEVLDQIGKAFVDNRSVSLFLLTLPMIALSERYGLKEQAIVLIRRMQKSTPGKLLMLYMVIRQFTGIFGIRISGMVQFVRPIVHPMASASARTRGLESPSNDERIKANSALSENIGNFFGQNGFVAASGVLLITGTMESLGYDVQPELVAAASLPMIMVAAVVAFFNFRILDGRLKRNASTTGTGDGRPATTTEVDDE